MSDYKLQKNATILVVDDSPMMRMFLMKMFSETHEVELKNSAVEALEWLYLNPEPELIITDLNMEGMNGLQLLQKIKQDENLKEAKVMVISGEKQSQTRIKSLELGADDYLLKPFNPQELYLRVNKLLEKVA
ncbi:MAG: response regulator [Bacteroidota bacterium]